MSPGRHPRFFRALNVLCFALAISDIITAVPDGISCSLYVDDFFIFDFAVCGPSDAVGDK